MTYSEMHSDKQNNPLDITAEQLLALLKQESVLYAAVNQNLQEKHATLIAGDAGKLQQIDITLTGLAQQLRQLEAQRTALLEENGLDPNRPLSEFLSAFRPEYAHALNQMRQELRGQVQTAQAMNQSQRGLISLSIQWIASTVEYIASVLNPEATGYTPRGNKQTILSSPASSDLTHSTIQTSG